MKKILVLALLTVLSSAETVFADSCRYTPANGQKIEFGNLQQPKISTNENDTIFSQNTDTNYAEKTVAQNVPKVSPSKDVKQKYKNITKNEKIIEACEYLKGGAGDFSYQSIHGRNKTNSPIEIEFADLSKNGKNVNADAEGKFVGKKYKISINNSYKDAPAQALAPVLAREGLVSAEKTETDKEEAKQLQIAVWFQMLEKYPYLANSQNSLVKEQNLLKENGDIQNYGVFLSKENPETKILPDKPKKKNNKKTNTKIKEKGQPLQENFDVKKQAEAEKIEAEILSYDSKALEKKYQKVTKEERIIEALELLQKSVGKFSHDAILGKNVTHKPIHIKFRNLEEINPKYSSFDALGWEQGGKLNIFINAKHADAPAAALAAILSHEALHQDKFDSLNEETYAWTMEASVWTQMCEKTPQIANINHPLVTRENLLKKLLEKGNYTNRYIKKSVFSNPSYSNLPVRSPGFEDDI